MAPKFLKIERWKLNKFKFSYQRICKIEIFLRSRKYIQDFVFFLGKGLDEINGHFEVGFAYALLKLETKLHQNFLKVYMIFIDANYHWSMRGTLIMPMRNNLFKILIFTSGKM